jgi:membrane dipeptidase
MNMNSLRMIDLHCDTLTKCPVCPGSYPNTLDNPSNQIALSKVPTNATWAQMFAIFVPDDKRGQNAIDYFDYYVKSFYAQAELNADRFQTCRTFSDLTNAFSRNKLAGILTVEGGCVLAGRMERVQALAQDGVKLLTLVWNGENEIGSGHDTEKGLTTFGKVVIPELEAHNIIIDASHLNDAGFEDLFQLAKKPFVASHSNARAIASHKRNLPDAFIHEISTRGGLIGLNFHMPFLNDNCTTDSFDNILRHVYHFLEQGAENALCLGSDYDGSTISPCLGSVEKAFAIRDYLIAHGISIHTVDGIMFENAYHFFEKNLRT